MGELLTRAYLLATGWTSGGISRAVDTGELVRLATGVYAQGEDYSAHVLYRLKVLAAASSCSGVVSHESAAAIHGIPFLNPVRDAVHFTVDRVHGGGRRPGVHVHPRPLDAAEVVSVNGIRLTSRARTAIDVAMTGGLIRAVGAIDAVRLRPRFPGPADPPLVSLDDLVGVLDRLGRRRGSAIARRALAASVEQSESPGESWSRMLMHAWAMPIPRLQTAYHLDGRQLFADFEWGSLIGECDGVSKYGESDDQRAMALAAEKERHSIFTANGFDVIRWGWDDLVDDSRLRRKLTPALARHGLLAA